MIKKLTIIGHMVIFTVGSQGVKEINDYKQSHGHFEIVKDDGSAVEIYSNDIMVEREYAFD